MSCFVMFRHAGAASAGLCGQGSRGGRQPCGRFRRQGGTGVPVLRAFRVCGRAGPRAFRGGAVRARDCPRETAGAPRPSVPAGVFFAAPVSHASAQKSRKAAPEAASLYFHSITLRLRSSHVREQKMKMPTETTSEQTAGAPMLFPARPSSSCPGRGTTGGALRHDEAASGARCSLTCIARSETMR